MKYKLNVNFSEESLKSIHEARQKVVILKQPKVPADIAVAWVCFNPFKSNTMEWDDDDYSIYASTSKIEDVTIINKLHEEMALPSIHYDFREGPFNAPLESSIYYAGNSSEEFPQITLGLSQKIVVNGVTYNKQPINAFSVPYGQNVEMEAGNHISVLLRKNIVSGMLLPYDSGNITIDYNERQEYTLLYDEQIGRFLVQE